MIHVVQMYLIALRSFVFGTRFIYENKFAALVGLEKNNPLHTAQVHYLRTCVKLKWTIITIYESKY